MIVDQEKCTGCGFCVRDCPLGAVRLKDKKAHILEHCSECGACLKVCEQGALTREESILGQAIVCDACPIRCQIKEGCTGACLRFKNVEGSLARTTPLHSFEDVKALVGPQPAEAITRPLITGIGAGTTYPDCKPAPHIVRGNSMGVDVVTVVTEAPLSYSGILVKVDTDVPVGEEGAPVFVGKRKVGLVTTEQYGAKMLSLGGVNLLTGKDGLLVARTIVDLANHKPVRLKVKDGARMEVQVGQVPTINGLRPTNMRVGCGSATLGLFAPLLLAAADEAVILDSHITGLLSQHAAGIYAGARPSGLKLAFRMSTPGRYFGDHGDGWGGTSISDPLAVVAGFEEGTARPGLRVLITETTGQHAALFQVGEDLRLHEVPLTAAAKEVIETLAATCEPSRVSALYMGGAGGSARAGVARYPLRLTRAVHAQKAHLTIGGAPACLLPGGGIHFLVDVERVKPGSFYWTPTPATICPIEYTMEVREYEAMGGHVEAMRPFQAKEPRMIVD